MYADCDHAVSSTFSWIQIWFIIVVSARIAGEEAPESPTSTVAFTRSAIVVEETGGSAVISVTRSGDTSKTVSVDYAMEGHTATPEADYQPVSGTLTFDAGETERRFEVPLLNDGLREGTERVDLLLGNPTGGAELGSLARATIRITDNDVGFELANRTITISEDRSAISLSVFRGDDLDGTVSVDFTTGEGTARVGEDYEAQSGTLFFQPDERSQTIILAILNDFVPESQENFRIVLSNPSGGTSLGHSWQTLIRVDDNDLGLRFDEAVYRVSENSSGAEITVLRGTDALNTMTVDYVTRDGTAKGGADFQPQSGTLSFEKGEDQKTLRISLLNDALFEADETLTVALSNPSIDAFLGSPSSASVVIEDNDVGIHFAENRYDVYEGISEATILVRRSDDLDVSATVGFETNPGSATPGEDYEAVFGTLTFEVGDKAQSFKVPILNDGLTERDETIRLILRDPTGVPVKNPAAVTLTIRDNDEGFNFFDPYFPEFNEGSRISLREDQGVAYLTVIRGNDSDQAIRVDYVTQNITAKAGEDYEHVSGTLSFERNQRQQTIVVPLLNDAIKEATESFRVGLTNPSERSSLGRVRSIVVRIEDNDQGIQFEGAGTHTVDEGAGAVALQVLRGDDGGQIVGIDYATADVTAVAGVDYVATSGRLTFQPGQTSLPIVVPLMDDDLAEGDKIFRMRLSNPTGGRLGGRTAPTIQIRDDDTSVVWVESEEVSESGGLAQINIRRRDGIQKAIQFDYETKDFSAKAGEDYEAVSGQLAFAPGEKQKTVQVAIVDDQIEEGTEVFRVVFSNMGDDARVEGRGYVMIDGRENVVTNPQVVFGYGNLQAIAASPDGQRVATGGSAGVFLWDVTTGNVLRSYKIPRGTIESLAFSPSGKQLLAGGNQVVAREFDPESPDDFQSDWESKSWLIDIESGEVLQSFDAAGRVALSPDGARMLAGKDGNLSLWEIESGRRILTFKLQDPNRPKAFSKDGRLLLTVEHVNEWPNESSLINIWEVATGTRLGSLTSLRYVHSLGFHADGQRFVAIGQGFPGDSEADRIVFWDIETMQVVKSQRMTGNATALSSDSTRVLSFRESDGRQRVELRDTETGTLIRSFQEEITWEVLFTSNQKGMLARTSGDIIRLWDLESGKVLQSFKGHTGWGATPVFSKNGHFLLNRLWGKTELWDARSGELIYSLPGRKGEFTPDGRHVIAGGEGVAQIWDVNTGEQVQAFAADTDSFRAVSMTPDGSTAATGGYNDAQDGLVRLWDAETAELLHTLDEPEDNVRAVMFSPDGESFLSTSWDESHVWDFDGVTLKFALSGGQARFSPDGKRVHTQGDGVNESWSSDTGERVFTVEGEIGGDAWTDSFLITPISADGRRMLTWNDSEVRLSDAKTGQELRTFGHPDTPSWSAAISDNGGLALIGNTDGRARLWDVETGSLLRTFDHGRENRGGEVFVNFSPAGTQVATALGFHTRSQTAQLWDISDLVRPRIEIRKTAAGLELNWSSGALQAAENINGPWIDVDAAGSPHAIQSRENREFFRVTRE